MAVESSFYLKRSHRPRKVLHDDRNSVEAMAIAATALVRMERIDKAQPFLMMAQQRKTEHPLLSFALSAFERLNGNIDGMLVHLERSIQSFLRQGVSCDIRTNAFRFIRSAFNALMRKKAQFHLLKPSLFSQKSPRLCPLYCLIWVLFV